MDRPVVGIATQTMQPIPGQVPLAWVMGQQYVRAHTAVGAIPWIIPLLQDDAETLRAIYDQLDAVFFAGGVDIEPTQYGERRIEQCGQSDAARDAVEMTLLQWAREDKKPVLGVCRGAQMINVACGGTLYQDLPSQQPTLKHDYFPSQGFVQRDMLAHPVRVEAGTKLQDIVGSASIEVNSMHHQGIKDLGAGLKPSAFAPDGLVEAVEGVNGQFLVGLQWHPEELVAADAAMKAVFTAFVAAAREYRNRVRTPRSIGA